MVTSTTYVNGPNTDSKDETWRKALFDLNARDHINQVKD